MANVLVSDSSLSAIADAIREKLDVQTTYKPGQMAAAIAGIETGGAAKQRMARNALVRSYSYDAQHPSTAQDPYFTVTLTLPSDAVIVSTLAETYFVASNGVTVTSALIRNGASVSTASTQDGKTVSAVYSPLNSQQTFMHDLLVAYIAENAITQGYLSELLQLLVLYTSESEDAAEAEA